MAASIASSIDLGFLQPAPHLGRAARPHAQELHGPVVRLGGRIELRAAGAGPHPSRTSPDLQLGRFDRRQGERELAVEVDVDPLAVRF